MAELSAMSISKALETTLAVLTTATLVLAWIVTVALPPETGAPKSQQTFLLPPGDLGGEHQDVS